MWECKASWPRGGRVQTGVGRSHHAAGGEVGALFLLLAVAQEAVEGPDAIGDEIVRFEEVKVLWWWSAGAADSGAGPGGVHRGRRRHRRPRRGPSSP